MIPTLFLWGIILFNCVLIFFLHPMQHTVILLVYEMKGVCLDLFVEDLGLFLPTLLWAIQKVQESTLPSPIWAELYMWAGRRPPGPACLWYLPSTRNLDRPFRHRLPSLPSPWLSLSTRRALSFRLVVLPERPPFALPPWRRRMPTRTSSSRASSPRSARPNATTKCSGKSPPSLSPSLSPLVGQSGFDPCPHRRSFRSPAVPHCSLRNCSACDAADVEAASVLNFRGG